MRGRMSDREKGNERERMSKVLVRERERGRKLVTEREKEDK